MIDLHRLREHPEQILALIAKKDPSYDGKLLYEYDTKLRSLKTEVEALRHEKNELAQKAKNGITDAIRQQSIAVGKLLKEKEEEHKELEQLFTKLYLFCPNLLSDDIPTGGKESNVSVREWGTKPVIKNPKNHVELGLAHKWFNFEVGATMAASNFVYYETEAVKLMYALTMFMLDHNTQYGYQPVLPPYLANEKTLEVASNFPKFRDQVFEVGKDNLFLIPTAEVSLANRYRDHIFSKEELPIRFTSWTSCFRREAGSYGATERGLIRIHQFEKVELYTYCTPENSSSEFDRMVECAEGILKKLGLHYRVCLLAAQDCSFASAKTYDLEVWMPGQGEYKEVSSCSNCTDFQSRRGGMRFRTAPAAKPELVHTLNGSSLALPRLMVAIMETYAQEDGTIAIPDCLKGYGLYK